MLHKVILAYDLTQNLPVCLGMLDSIDYSYMTAAEAASSPCTRVVLTDDPKNALKLPLSERWTAKQTVQALDTRHQKYGSRLERGTTYEGVLAIILGEVDPLTQLTGKPLRLAFGLASISEALERLQVHPTPARLHRTTLHP